MGNNLRMAWPGTWHLLKKSRLYYCGPRYWPLYRLAQIVSLFRWCSIRGDDVQGPTCICIKLRLTFHVVLLGWVHVHWPGASKHNLNSSDFELVRRNHNPWFFGVISALMFVRICTIDPSKWKFKQRKLQCLHNALPIAYSQEIIFGILSAETSCIVKGRMSLFCQIIPVLSNSL
jgi:hypothetical protein